MTESDARAVLTLVDAFVPRLTAGEYTLEATQTLYVEIKAGTFDYVPKSDTKTFRVRGPRFTLAPDEIYSRYPADGHRGAYHETVPHVVCRRKALPWERPLVPDHPPHPDSTTAPEPWMALLLFDETELPDPPFSECSLREVVAPLAQDDPRPQAHARPVGGGGACRSRPGAQQPLHGARYPVDAVSAGGAAPRRVAVSHPRPPGRDSRQGGCLWRRRWLVRRRARQPAAGGGQAQYRGSGFARGVQRPDRDRRSRSRRGHEGSPRRARTLGVRIRGRDVRGTGGAPAYTRTRTSGCGLRTAPRWTMRACARRWRLATFRCSTDCGTAIAPCRGIAGRWCRW